MSWHLIAETFIDNAQKKLHYKSFVAHIRLFLGLVDHNIN